MTPAQLTTLKAAILSDSALTAYLTNPDGRRDDLIADYYNAPSLPAITVWRTSVTRDEVTVDGFDWTQVDNLTTGQGRIWDWLFSNAAQAINPSEPGKRSGISECWKMTAAKVAVATFVFGKCKRTANRLEALFSAGVGSIASPAAMGVEGVTSAGEISALLNQG